MKTRNVLALTIAIAGLALTAAPANAAITIVGSTVKGFVDSTKTQFATTHLGTTLVSYNATGVSKLVVVFGSEPGNNNQVLTITGVKFNGVALTKAVNDNTRVTASYDDGMSAPHEEAMQWEIRR